MINLKDFVGRDAFVNTAEAKDIPAGMVYVVKEEDGELVVTQGKKVFKMRAEQLLLPPEIRK